MFKPFNERIIMNRKIRNKILNIIEKLMLWIALISIMFVIWGSCTIALPIFLTSIALFLFIVLSGY